VNRKEETRHEEDWVLDQVLMFQKKEYLLPLRVDYLLLVLLQKKFFLQK